MGQLHHVCGPWHAGRGGAVVHIPVVFCPGVSNISALKKALWCFLCTLSFEKLWFRILGLEDEKKKPLGIVRLLVLTGFPADVP